jgi:hypothetical protein
MGTYTAANAVDHFSSSREAFELMTSCLASGEALTMSHVDVERYVVEEAGREVLRLLLQDAFELRATKEVIAPVEGADGIDRRCGAAVYLCGHLQRLAGGLVRSSWRHHRGRRKNE